MKITDLWIVQNPECYSTLGDILHREPAATLHQWILGAASMGWELADGRALDVAYYTARDEALMDAVVRLGRQAGIDAADGEYRAGARDELEEPGDEPCPSRGDDRGCLAGHPEDPSLCTFCGHSVAVEAPITGALEFPEDVGPRYRATAVRAFVRAFNEQMRALLAAEEGALATGGGRGEDQGLLMTRGPYTIRPLDDLGSNGSSMFGEHLSLDEMRTWLDEHVDEGTFEIIDESDGRPACGYDTQMSGGAWGCDCGRPSCGQETAVGIPGDWHVRGPITVETESFIPPAEIGPARIDKEHEAMVMGGLRVTFSGLVTEGMMAGWWCVKGTSQPRADDEPVVVARVPAAGGRDP